MFKELIKNYALPILIKLGVEKLPLLFAKNNVLNIFYHGVVKQDASRIFGRHIVRDQFEQHMKYISKKFNVISLPEAFQMYRTGTRPDQKTVTVSFDDGYLNNLETALPILEKYNIKTTFFISSICIEQENYIMSPDLLALARYFSTEDFLTIDGLKFMKTGKYGLINAETKKSAYFFLKELPYLKRDQILHAIEEKYQIRNNLKSLPTEFWKLMNKAQLKQLSESSLVSIGSHGHLHYNLAEISRESCNLELSKSKELLSKCIGTPISMLSYPDGSYNEAVKKQALENGYTDQFAVNYQCPSDVNDKHILNRWGVSGTTSYETVMFSMNNAFIKHAI
jgi:peptidoglycan/xylan/chitin deacetylase (PgdA/CDA1 family)